MSVLGVDVRQVNFSSLVSIGFLWPWRQNPFMSFHLILSVFFWFVMIRGYGAVCSFQEYPHSILVNICANDERFWCYTMRHDHVFWWETGFCWEVRESHHKYVRFFGLDYPRCDLKHCKVKAMWFRLRSEQSGSWRVNWDVQACMWLRYRLLWYTDCRFRYFFPVLFTLMVLHCRRVVSWQHRYRWEVLWYNFRFNGENSPDIPVD